MKREEGDTGHTSFTKLGRIIKLHTVSYFMKTLTMVKRYNTYHNSIIIARRHCLWQRDTTTYIIIVSLLGCNSMVKLL